MSTGIDAGPAMAFLRPRLVAVMTEPLACSFSFFFS